MSKRTATIIAALGTVGVLLAIGLIFSSLANSPSPGAWIHDWLGKTDGVAAIASLLAAIATFAAVVVGILAIREGQRIARKAEETHRQFREAQYGASRPLLVPFSESPGAQVSSEEEADFDWTAPARFATIQNVGTGIATNVCVAIFPPQSMPETSMAYFSRVATPIAPEGEPLRVDFTQGETAFTTDDQIDEYSLSVPQERPDQNGKAPSLARLTMTCRDILGGGMRVSLTSQGEASGSRLLFFQALKLTWSI